MKKKGFTLVEILAVVVILGLLAIIVMPNVLDMFKEAKQKSFESELKEIYRVAQQQWVSDSKEDTKVFARSNSESCKSQLDLSGRKNVEYYIQLDSKGNIIKYYASDGTYQYKYIGEGLKIADIEDSLEITRINNDNRIQITCNTSIGDYYYTANAHKINKSSSVFSGDVKMYTTPEESISNTGERFFIRHAIDGYKQENGTSYYCAVNDSTGENSCNNGLSFDTLSECEDAIEANGVTGSYHCEEFSHEITSGIVTQSMLGYEKNGNYYYIDRSQGYDANKTALINNFGSSNCITACIDSNYDPLAESSEIMNITPSKMVDSAGNLDNVTCNREVIACRDDKIGIYYDDTEAYAENVYYGSFERWDYVYRLGREAYAPNGREGIMRMAVVVSNSNFAMSCSENIKDSGCSLVSTYHEHIG